MTDERKPQRLSVTVSAELNDWLDAESKRMAMPKSAIVHFATEQYRQLQAVTGSMPSMVNFLDLEAEKIKNER